MIVKYFLATLPDTSLWWSIVFAWRWRSGASTASFLDAQRSTLDDLTLQAIFRSIGLLWCHHFDEAKSSGFTSMRVAHNVAFLYVAIFLEQSRHFFLAESRVDPSHEQVCTRIARVFVFLRTSIRWNTATSLTRELASNLNNLIY